MDDLVKARRHELLRCGFFEFGDGGQLEESREVWQEVMLWFLSIRYSPYLVVGALE